MGQFYLQMLSLTTFEERIIKTINLNLELT